MRAMTQSPDAPDFSPAALQAVAAFLPILDAPGFQFTEEDPVDPGPQRARTVRLEHHFLYSSPVHALVTCLYELGWVQGFEWPAWARTPEAGQLRDDPDALARATAPQLSRLLTGFVRQERFAEGSMLGFWRSGLLLGILRRVAALARGEEPR